jgi:hypothetical protein
MTHGTTDVIDGAWAASALAHTVIRRGEATPASVPSSLSARRG